MVTTSVLSRLKDIHSWLGYSPHFPQYIKHSPYVVFAAIKIADVYSALCIARANLYYYEMNNYGDLSGNDKVSLKFMKWVFIQNAVIYYNIAADMSLQAVWSYCYRYDIGNKLPDKILHDRITETCNYQAVMLSLTLCKDYKLREYVKSYDKIRFCDEVRSLYNYIKHRGSFYIDGLGINEKEHMFKINSRSIPAVYREELDLKKTASHLEKFDNGFVTYCEGLISMLIPGDNKTGCNIEDMINYYNSHKNEIDMYNK